MGELIIRIETILEITNIANGDRSSSSLHSSKPVAYFEVTKTIHAVQENYRRMLAEALLKDYTGSVNDLCETPLATFVNEVKYYLAICKFTLCQGCRGNCRKSKFFSL